MPAQPGSFPISVTVLTGFLGAGKTTLVNRLLKDPALADTAVIVNEFGDVPIDHLLVEASSDGVVEMGGGCLCCTVRGELAGTLSDLAARVERGAIPRLARVIIETTGLADPVPVLHSLMADPLTAESFSLDGVVTVVDAANGGATLDAHAEAVRQVAVADRIVLSKTDLAEATDLAGLTERLRLLNPAAAIVSGPDAGYAALFNCGLYDPATKTADVARWLNEEALHQAEHRQGEAGHEHEHEPRHRHDSRVGSFVLADPRPLPLAALEMFLDLLLSTHGHRLLRLKGIVETTEQPDRPFVIHAVQQILHPPARLPSWPDAQRGVRLVLIGFDLPERYARDLFSAFVNRPAVDRPDRAALADNPLSVPGFSRS